jgi:hypothetical protein
MSRSIRYAAPVAALFAVSSIHHAQAHAIAGDRVFPVTLTLDDPGVADEVTLPQITDQPGAGPSNSTQYQWEWDKTITPNTVLIYNHGYDVDTMSGSKRQTGFENAVITGKWQAYVNPDHEFIVSLGVQRELSGNVQTVNIGGDKYGSTGPTIYFGKGFGDLPIQALRPFAVTGELTYTIPDRPLNTAGDNSGTARSLFGGLSLQYSLPYLQANVKDYGLPDFVNRLVPLIELNYNSPVGGPAPGNPMKLQTSFGAIYMADTYQVGIEAIAPLNNAAGQRFGAIVQVHFFLDDILPNSLGKPLFQ